MTAMNSRRIRQLKKNVGIRTSEPTKKYSTNFLSFLIRWKILNTFDGGGGSGSKSPSLGQSRKQKQKKEKKELKKYFRSTKKNESYQK